MNTSDTFYSPNFNWNGDFDRLQDDYELFYDEEGQVTQFRLNLKDDDADIRKKALIISVKTFSEPIFLYYEKHKTEGDKKIIEYYNNDNLATYTETTKINSIEVKRFFNGNGLLFCIDKTYFDTSGKIKCAQRYIQNEEGKLVCLELVYHDEIGRVVIDNNA